MKNKQYEIGEKVVATVKPGIGPIYLPCERSYTEDMVKLWGARATFTADYYSDTLCFCGLGWYWSPEWLILKEFENEE